MKWRKMWEIEELSDWENYGRTRDENMGWEKVRDLTMIGENREGTDSRETV